VLYLARGLNALGALHSAPGAVWVVALWEPAAVACYSVALLLVSSGVFILSAVIQCSFQPRGAMRSGGAAFCSGSGVGDHALGGDACCILHHAVLVYFVLLRQLPSGASATSISVI
jgi:hypothetical protein